MISKVCEKENGGDGTPHGDFHFQLLLSCCEFLEAESHLDNPETVGYQGIDCAWNVEDLLHTLDEFVMN